MTSQIKFIALIVFFSLSTPTYAQEQWSLAPAKAVIMTFWASMAVIGKPDIGTLMYRYVALSPLAVITAGAATVAWNVLILRRTMI